MRNESTSCLIHYLIKLCHIKFMVLITNIKSSPTLHDVNLVNYGPILIKIDNKCPGTHEQN